MKVYAERKHADALMQGTIFANPISYFRQIEKGDIRRDTDEGIMTMPLTEGFKLELTSNAIDNPIVMKRDDLAKPLAFRPRWFDAINLFCMHIIDLHKEVNTGTFSVPNRVMSFGHYAVVILDVYEFIRRVKETVNKAGYRLSYKSVEYNSPAEGIHTNPATLEPIFTKRNDYQEEQEFRVAIDRSLAVPTPLKLDIRPIHDLAKLLVWETRLERARVDRPRDTPLDTS